MNLIESPCRQCPTERQDQDKEECCWTCRILRMWQELDDPSLGLKRRYAKIGDVDCACGLCSICGGQLVVEDGCLFCKRCLSTYLRDPGYDSVPTRNFSPFIAKRLLGKYGWPVDQVAEITHVTETYLIKWYKASSGGR